uniref:RNase H type-1 domain-containing protein n=1 Tax=Aegilops tauschii subsp. strangulata TaxID=200361 RepID=A0A453JMD1_AEGTS
PSTWCKDILCDFRINEGDRAKIITVMWAIWTSRNNITHDKESLKPAQALKRIRETLMLLELPLEHTRIMPGFGWRPPELEYVKINTDASVSMTENRSGVGGLARTSSTFVAAWSKPHLNVTDPLTAEAPALRDGVIFGKLQGLQRVVFETDCLELVQLWNSQHFTRSVIAPILLDIEELASSFPSFDIQHVFRQANTSAHLCAKHASTLGVTDCWMNSPPGFLVTSLLADRAGAGNV